MNRRIPVEPSPVAGLLRRLQTNAGWGMFVSDDLKSRMIRQLERIALDDSVPPATQVAAIACSMKASALELETVNTLVRLYEATELERRVDELSRRLDPVATEPDFVELEPPDDLVDLVPDFESSEPEPFLPVMTPTAGPADRPGDAADEPNDVPDLVDDHDDTGDLRDGPDDDDPFWE